MRLNAFPPNPRRLISFRQSQKRPASPRESMQAIHLHPGWADPDSFAVCPLAISPVPARPWWLLPFRLLLAGLFLSAGIFGAERVYQHRHLSADVRAALVTIANAPVSAPRTELALSSAKVRLHTLRDREVWGELDFALRLRKHAAASEQLIAAHRSLAPAVSSRQIHKQQLLLLLEEAYLAGHRPLPVFLLADIDQELAQGQQTEAQGVREQSQYMAEAAQANTLWRKARADLGLTRSSSPRFRHR